MQSLGSEVNNVLLVPYTESLGHAGRALEFAHSLSKQQEVEIKIAGGGQFDFIFPYKTTTTPQVPYLALGNWLRFYLPCLPFFENGDTRHLSDLERTVGDKGLALEVMTERWLAVLTEQTPDLLIVDGRPDVYLAAQVLGIPVFGIVSFVWTEHFAARYGLVSETDGAKNTVLLHNFNRVGEQFGQPAITDCWQPFHGRGKLVADSITFTGTNLPNGYFSIGPNIWKGMAYCKMGFVDELAGNRPLVYVTSGTSSFSIFYEVAQVLRAKGIQIVLSGGIRETKSPGFRKEGELYICSGIVPGMDLIHRADVVLCHGGAQTLYQAAAADTLAFVLPQHFDHKRNGMMFARHGFARLLSAELTAAEVADEILVYLDGDSAQRSVPHLEMGGVDTDRLFRFFEALV